MAKVICLMIFLGVMAAQDFITRKVYIYPIIAFGIAGVVLSISNGTPVGEIVSGVLFGILLLLIGKMTGKIGGGDGLIFMATGAYIGLVENLVLFYVASILAVGYGLTEAAMKNDGSIKGKSLPFIPFVFASYCVMVAGSHLTLN